MVRSLNKIAIPPVSSDELAQRGWRYQTLAQPDGRETTIQIPLTDEEFLHPKEGYHLPNNTFHDRIIATVQDILNRRYDNCLDVAVFHDLLIQWDFELGEHSPDIFVVFGIEDKKRERTKFVVAKEGVRPAFILEVVSPRYRKQDRETKVVEYAQAGVQEYVIVDRRRQRGQLLEEVLGYQLERGHYRPIAPDEQGRIACETLGVSIGLEDGQLLIFDTQTGERLQTASELAALLARYRQLFGELPE
jgi:Uma2 family endonuclease